MVLQILYHLGIPQTPLLQLLYKVAISHNEITGEISLGIKILIGRLNGLTHADDVGDGRGGRNSHGIAIAHAVSGDGFTYGRPVHLRATIQGEVAAALLLQQTYRINRQQTAVPFGRLVGLVAPRSAANSLEARMA